MRGWKAGWGLALALMLVLTLTGCSDVLVESKRPDGGLERIRVDSGESWGIYDDKPRNPYSKSKKDQQDDLSIMLKKESTF